jgi:hypothetical protein
MSSSTVDQIRAHLEGWVGGGYRYVPLTEYLVDVAALIAEVERLRTYGLRDPLATHHQGQGEGGYPTLPTTTVSDDIGSTIDITQRDDATETNNVIT